MKFSPEVATAFAIALALFAYVLGRNPLLWFVIGYLVPVFGWILLAVRHFRKPKFTPFWILDSVSKVKTKLWARDLQPEDFNEPPKGDGK